MRAYLAKGVRNLPYQVISRFKNLEPENAISLFCDPRGGSTWLAETLKSIPYSMIIDEPLHLNNVKAFKRLDFSWRQHIPEHENWSEAKAVFDSILKGKLLNTGIGRLNSFSEIIQSRQIILKIIRGKALLPWYVRQFDFKYKPLVLVRHPFAVAASMLRHGAWDYTFKKFEMPKGPYNEFYKEHAPFLTSLQTKEEQLTALWCMTNNVVLNHPENDRSWISLNYEDLVLEPMKNFQMIFEKWNIEIPQKLAQKISIPSSTTVGKQHIDPKILLSDWKNKLNREQINRLKKVLDYFDINYYNEEILPLIPAGEVHLKRAKK